MKKIYSFLLLVATLAVSCTNYNEIDQTGKQSDLISTISVELAQTPRTALGEREDGYYPLYWSEGDVIAVNGVCSGEAQINTQNRSVAKFDLLTEHSYPLSITYPYTSSTSKSAPTVIFPAEQRYTEGTFDNGSAPLYGYVTNSSENIVLHHLAGVLRFPMKSSDKSVVLDRIVITSANGSKIAGEFTVNCTNGALTPSSNAVSSVTYTLPENFILSSDKESVLYIALPDVNVGNCTVEFFDGNGGKMSSTWNSNNLTAGKVNAFQPIIYKRGTTFALTTWSVEEDCLDIKIYAPTVYGYVKDSNGKPIKGVAVSDGFQVVATDSNGYYTLENVTKDTWFIYITIPAEYEVPINELGQPCFYQSYPGNSARFDFTLTPLPGGKEKEFALFTFADPQVSDSNQLVRFNNEAIPGVRAHYNTFDIPCYGITLGDIISNSVGNNDEVFRTNMRDGFHINKVGMPVFQVMGNHDCIYCSAENTIQADDRSSTFNLKMQRNHEEVFGPANYSFDRGDLHIIGMRDIVYNNPNDNSKHSLGFLPEQVEWLRQDLALVPKSKKVILCVHIPIYNQNSNYTQEVLGLLNEYTDPHIISGHTHYQRLYSHAYNNSSWTKIYEHNTNALCGIWWAANISADGTPNGWNVFISNTSDKAKAFRDWYYIGYKTTMNERSHQMRLYRGNAITGAATPADYTGNAKGYYKFNFADNVILANIYNADFNWTIEVYEDGVKTGNMTHITNAVGVSYKNKSGSGTKTNPYYVNYTDSSLDLYAQGLFIGILGRIKSDGVTPSSGSWQRCYHMYKYTLKNKNAQKIEVVATDPFGNVYRESNFQNCTDYTYSKK